MDKKKLGIFKGILLSEKERLLLNLKKAAIASELNISTDDLSDEVDLAAIQISQNLTFRLRDRERQLLVKIEQALDRISDGSFGLCMDCEEVIEMKRLEARPISTHCLVCKELQEHKERVYA